MKKTPIIPYPWEDAEIHSKDAFWLFGYGSLINQASAQETLDNNLLIPCIAHGIKRVFNYSPDATVLARPMYQDPTRGPRYSAALNVQYTGNANDHPNGVLRKITKAELPQLIERERGYHLIKIKCTDFFNLNTTYEAYALSAPEYFENRQLIDNSLLPKVPYYRICKQGAAEISDDFLAHWMATTFIGDGRPVAEWEVEEGFTF